MADDKSKRDRRDRSKVSTEQPYELSYFRRKHKLTKEQAEEIIRKSQNSRERANELAKKLKK